MPRQEVVQLEVKTSVATGAQKDVLRLSRKWWQVGGTFVATLQLKGSINGTDFVNIGAAVSAPALVEIAPSVKLLKVETTAYTSGTPTAHVAGFDENS